MALCEWIGGCNEKPLLIWESNGPGVIFDRRVHQLGYGNVYYRREERKMHRPRKQLRGWHSSADSKEDIIYGYREALSLTYREDAALRKFINPDAQAVSECEDYIFYSTGRIGPYTAEAEEGGAKATHGDRVIADALCNLGRIDQRRVIAQAPRAVPNNSIAARREYHQAQSRQNKDMQRWQD